MHVEWELRNSDSKMIGCRVIGRDEDSALILGISAHYNGSKCRNIMPEQGAVHIELFII